MKRHDEMTERELLLIVEERTRCLPDLTKRVNKHDVVIGMIVVVLIFVTAKLGWTFVADAIAKVHG